MPADPGAQAVPVGSRGDSSPMTASNLPKSVDRQQVAVQSPVLRVGESRRQPVQILALLLPNRRDAKSPLRQATRSNTSGMNGWSHMFSVAFESLQRVRRHLLRFSRESSGAQDRKKRRIRILSARRDRDARLQANEGKPNESFGAYCRMLANNSYADHLCPGASWPRLKTD